MSILYWITTPLNGSCWVKGNPDLLKNFIEGNNDISYADLIYGIVKRFWWKIFLFWYNIPLSCLKAWCGELITNQYKAIQHKEVYTVYHCLIKIIIHHPKFLSVLTFLIMSKHCFHECVGNKFFVPDRSSLTYSIYVYTLQKWELSQTLIMTWPEDYHIFIYRDQKIDIRISSCSLVIFSLDLIILLCVVAKGW